MFGDEDIRNYYEKASLGVPECWNLSRKHFRVMLRDGRFIKLNRYRSRVNIKGLRRFCVEFAPVHVYFSVLDWRFPERVDVKRKARYAVPVGGEYVVEVDSHNVRVPHNHYEVRGVCRECLYISKRLALHICDAIEENYRDVRIVFSGRKGFHIHVLDFDRQGFNRYHFIVSTDPMRIISLLKTLNGETGLTCLLLSGRKRLEKTSINTLVNRARFDAHPESHECVNMHTISDA